MPPKGIKILYKYVDGAHFFVSDDKMAAGLCVAHADLRIAYEEVPQQLKALFKFNHKQNLDFEPSIPIEKFEQMVQAYLAASGEFDTEKVAVPASIQPWMVQAPN